MVLQDTPLLFLMYLHTRAIGLLYKCNITLTAMRYGCILARCDVAISHGYSFDIAHLWEQMVTLVKTNTYFSGWTMSQQGL